MLKRFLGGGLSRRVGNAGFWTAIEFGGNSGLRLVSNLILTRILSPEIFGLMALAQVFLNGITMLSDVGVRTSVIRSSRGDEPVFLQTAWTMQIIRGAVITGLCCLIAWPLSAAYDEPILFPLLSFLSLAALIKGFQSISVVQANRQLMLKRLTYLTLIVRVTTLVVTVFAAWQLQSVWALAIGTWVGVIVNVSLSHTMLQKFDHRLLLDPSAVREVVKFGRWILLATFFTFLGSRGQQAMFGLVVPVEVIGLIAIATLLAQIPAQFFTKLVNTVVLPSFSKIIRDRPKDLPRALRRVRLAVIGMAFPMFFTVAFLAQPIIDFLYDDRYQAAGVILAFSAMNGAVPLLSGTYQNLLLAEGRSGVHATLMFLWATTTIAGIFAGFSMYGLVGSLVGIAIGTSTMFFVNLAIAVRQGHATGRLDITAFVILVLAYVGVIWTTDIPPAFLSPALAGEIMG